MDPSDLKTTIGHGLLSFPLTDFTPDLAFDADGYARRLAWLTPFGATALFAAGGTGEFFSLAPAEYRRVVEVATRTCAGRVPIIAGAGAGHALAVDFARSAEAAGASGILLLPHYLTEASQAGVAAHVRAVCRAVGIGVIVYNRGACRLGPAALERLADECSNLVGFKDGIGDIELMMAIRRRLGDRFAYLGGLPTAEVFAPAYRAMGVPVYSSAVFNFLPDTAMAFYRAIDGGDAATVNRLLDTFFLPYVELRNRGAGYAVSIVKAGARLVGHGAGPVRPPLTDLTDAESHELAALIERAGGR
ncbi:5-dehydro-4-deoxyglucarate dehydratase [Burkholderiales bacterium]|nr:5-dehydro-4-deoxyglucarate dehydratase [Burkholderiales bacterium]